MLLIAVLCKLVEASHAKHVQNVPDFWFKSNEGSRSCRNYICAVSNQIDILATSWEAQMPMCSLLPHNDLDGDGLSIYFVCSSWSQAVVSGEDSRCHNARRPALSEVITCKEKFGAAEKHGKTQFTILVNAEKSKHWSSSPTVSFPRPSKRPSQQHRWFLEDAANGPLGADGRGPTSLELGSGLPIPWGVWEGMVEARWRRHCSQQGATRESWTNLIQLSSTLQTRRRPSLSPLVMQFCKSLRDCLLLPTTQVRLVRVLRIAKFARHSEAPGCNQHPLLDWDFPCPRCLSDIAIHGPP